MIRTRIQTLEHIQAQFEAGKLGAQNTYGGCVYESPDKTTNCAVGCLLSAEQMAAINGANAQHQNLSTLDSIFVKHELPTLQQTTGFNHDELYNIQVGHDAWAKREAGADKEERGIAFMEHLNGLKAKEAVPA